MKKATVINNCKIEKNEIIVDAGGIRNKVTWSCLLCNRFYIGETPSSYKDLVKCLEDCQNPFRNRNWKEYLRAEIKDLKVRKRHARGWISRLTEDQLILAITELFTKEVKGLTLGEKRILTLLLQEDKKRSRSQICQQ